jgi:site-specific recombinase XerD
MTNEVRKRGYVDMLPENEQDLQKFVQVKKVNGESAHTTELYDRYLREFDMFLGKTFRQATENDVMSYITWRAGLCKESTLLLVKCVVKTFYKFLYNLEDSYPEQVRRVKLTLSKRGRKLRIQPHEVLDKNDIATLIKHCTNVRDEAMVATLYESGARLAEFAGMKVHDLVDVKHGKQLSVRGKTGERRILLVESVPYINKWLQSHPTRDEPDAPLWTTLGQPYGKLADGHIQHIFEALGKKARIGKPTNCHNFRHSRATFLARFMTDGQLKVYFGWTGSSLMVGTYTHLNGRDTDSAIQKSSGIEDEEEVIQKSPLLEKTCERCHSKNVGTNEFCGLCGKPFNENRVEVLEQSNIDERLAKMIADGNARTLEAMERRLSDLQIQIAERQVEKQSKVNGHVCPKCGQEPQGQAVKTWMLGESTLVSRFGCQCGSQFNVYEKLTVPLQQERTRR